MKRHYFMRLRNLLVISTFWLVVLSHAPVAPAAIDPGWDLFQTAPSGASSFGLGVPLGTVDFQPAAPLTHDASGTGHHLVSTPIPEFPTVWPVAIITVGLLISMLRRELKARRNIN